VGGVGGTKGAAPFKMSIKEKQHYLEDILNFKRGDLDEWTPQQVDYWFYVYFEHSQ